MGTILKSLLTVSFINANPLRHLKLIKPFSICQYKGRNKERRKNQFFIQLKHKLTFFMTTHVLMDLFL